MVNVNVNGQERAFDGDPSMPLMWYVRDELGLTGTKFGCGVALCGACTVHLNGEAIRSCSIPMSDVAGKKVVTGGSATGENAGAHRRADRHCHVRQHLPVRLLSAHSFGRSRRREGDMT